MNVSWSEAECAKPGVDPEIFFPDRLSDGPARQTKKTAAARAVCKRCPIRESVCLPYAMEHVWDVPMLEGVWGGTTITQRLKLRASMPRPKMNERRRVPVERKRRSKAVA